MAEEKDQAQKTELPTQKRLDDARKKGEVARAPEVKHAAMFAGACVTVSVLLTLAAGNLAPAMRRLLGEAHGFDLSGGGALELMRALTGDLALGLAPAFAALTLAAMVGGLASGRPALAWKRVKPELSKISPLKGVKRLFGPQGLAEFIKTNLKFLIVAAAAVVAVWPSLPRLEHIAGGTAEEIAALTLSLTVRMLLAVTALVIVMALADFAWQRRSFTKRMMMTRQEVKDEQKDTEGSPETRARLQRLRQEKASRRMMAEVPGAAVVIMNPVHFAVALSYRHGETAVPACVAKGTDAVALRIRAVAEEAGVPVVENPPLARALHAGVEIGDPIPADHYQAVANVISFVLGLNDKAAR